MTDPLYDNVTGTAARLRADAAAGIVRPSVSTELISDVSAVSRFTQYGREFEFRCDESEGRGGQGEHPSPLRYLLSSLGFCVQVWCAKTAALHDFPVRSLRVDVTTYMDMRGEHLVGDVPAHPQWFQVTVVFGSPGSPEAARRVAEEALRRCPVAALLTRAVPIELSVTCAGEAA